MTTNANKKKSEQLGISHGTACNRLRKMILFRLIQETNQDICFRCEKKISTVEELSIEHKKRWLDSKNPKKLFFDLDNIAFSHRKCNKPRKQKIKKLSKHGFRGVSKQRKRFIAEIKKDRKSYRSLSFSTSKEAARAYDKMAIELYGNKAITNEKLGLL